MGLSGLADVEASDQVVFYPKNMAAYLIEQQVALEIARGQMDLDMRRSIRVGREANRLGVGVDRCP